ncbi:MAG: glycine--tRNA ligase subunit beta, partial [Deltaproteobacteria bacterium]
IDSVEPFAEELVDRLYVFFAGRLKQRLVEMLGTRPDIVEAVLEVGFDDMYLARLRLEALCEFMERPGFEDLAVAFKRVSSILKDFDDGGEPDTEMFELEEERALYGTMQELKPQVDRLMEQARYLDCLELLGSRLRGPVDRFFDKVLVNDPQNPEQTRNRKRLLRKVESLFVRLADFGRLRTSGKL